MGDAPRTFPVLREPTNAKRTISENDPQGAHVPIHGGHNGNQENEFVMCAGNTKERKKARAAKHIPWY